MSDDAPAVARKRRRDGVLVFVVIVFSSVGKVRLGCDQVTVAR
jgi:hypothetical protein